MYSDVEGKGKEEREEKEEKEERGERVYLLALTSTNFTRT